MDLFETIKASFRLLAGGFTQNKLIIVGIIVLALMIVWGVLSILFNSTVKFNKNAVDMMKTLKTTTITRENYSKFIEKFKKFPLPMRYAWKRYEVKREGKPSDYLKKSECLDAVVFGGIQKQSRSLMRTAIYVIFFFMSVVSVAIIGATTASTTTKVALTTTLLADSMLVPLITLFILFINYYIYTNVRNQEYRTASDNFYDLVDTLDERVDLNAIFGLDNRTIGLLSSVYINETMELIEEKNRKARAKNKFVGGEVRVGKSGFKPLNNGVLGGDEKNNMADNVVNTEEVFANKLTANENELKLDTSKESNFKIKNEVHFVEVVTSVEVLMNRIETETNLVKKQAIEREVNTLIKALTEYKQKAKAKQARKTTKKK